MTRPGGTIALASWTPDGFIGAMFGTVAAHVPPPAGLASPMLWGTEEHLAELFGPDVTWTHRRRTFTFRFVSADAFLECFAAYYGPTLKALEAAGPARDALASDLRDLAPPGTASSSPAPSPCRARTSSRSGSTRSPLAEVTGPASRATLKSVTPSPGNPALQAPRASQGPA